MIEGEAEKFAENDITFRKVHTSVQRVLECSDERLRDLLAKGMSMFDDSLDRLEVVLELENEFNITISDEEQDRYINNNATLESITAFVNGKTKSKS